MTRGAESSGLAGKHEKLLLPTVWTPDTGKSTLRIGTVQILPDNILDYRTEIPVLLFKMGLIFSKEPFKIIKKYPVKERVFRMTLAVDPWHSREDDSQNGPGSRNEPQRPDSPGMLPS